MDERDRATIWFDQETRVWWWKIQRAGGSSTQAVALSPVIAAIDLALALAHKQAREDSDARAAVVSLVTPSPKES